MKIFAKIRDIKAALAQERANKKSVGFVPTMGALHAGHISLVEKARKENGTVATSIFVNPTQFNNPEDLKKYPRNLEKDSEMLKSAKNDIVFNPEAEEMYPANEAEEYFNFEGLDTVMEGKFRPGHFQGVARVVAKLFRIVEPDRVYFGDKDYQQLLIIRKILGKLFPKITIVSCPTVREKDGLAMSSRNALLDEATRAEAPLIFKTLLKVKEMKNAASIAELKKMVVDNINSSSTLRVEYFEIADENNLVPLSEINKNARAFIAVQAGKVRLIDNLSLNF
ncbi:MAG TPA: pantoate--beta-alanine ligase [Chitinophagaceae bacterium]|nr:pantoate--beta-alanine ligase [Chitinophagaceae bacterium]